MTENATVKLTRLNGEIQSRMLNHLRDSAEKIADLAKLNVPVDMGSVEGSISTMEKRDGIRHATTIEVGVDPEKLAESRESLDRDPNFRYDLWLHEAEYNLGEASEMKDMTVRAINPKARVGSKFLERAYLSLRREIESEAQTIAARVARQLGNER